MFQGEILYIMIIIVLRHKIVEMFLHRYRQKIIALLTGSSYFLKMMRRDFEIPFSTDRKPISVRHIFYLRKETRSSDY